MLLQEDRRYLSFSKELGLALEEESEEGFGTVDRPGSWLCPTAQRSKVNFLFFTGA
jgi:hypothetical protein